MLDIVSGKLLKMENKKGKWSHEASLLAFTLVLAFARVSGLSENLPSVTRQVVGFFLVAHDVNELQVLRGEQQPVEVVQVHL